MFPVYVFNILEYVCAESVSVEMEFQISKKYTVWDHIWKKIKTERYKNFMAIHMHWGNSFHIYFYVFTYGTFQIERRKDAITIVVDNVYLQLALFFFFSQLKILTNKELLAK